MAPRSRRPWLAIGITAACGLQQGCLDGTVQPGLTLVIFVIRTAGNPFKSRPSLPLVGSVVGGLSLGLLAVLTPVRDLLGFAPLPPPFFGVLVLFVVTYLGLVQLLKRRIYTASGWGAAVPATSPASAAQLADRVERTALSQNPPSAHVHRW